MHLINSISYLLIDIVVSSVHYSEIKPLVIYEIDQGSFKATETLKMKNYIKDIL